MKSLSVHKQLIAIFATSICVATMVQAQERATVTGRVVDAITGSAVRGAMIQLSDTTLKATTNKRGVFTIKRVPPGSYVLGVLRMGYASIDSIRLVVGAADHKLPDIVMPLSTTMILCAIPGTSISDPVAGNKAPYSTAIIRFDERYED